MPVLESIVIPQTIQAGSTVIGAILLGKPAPAGSPQITITSSNTNAVIVDSPITVIQGATSATFKITSAANASGSATIRAVYNRGTPKEAEIKVEQPHAAGDSSIDPSRRWTGFMALAFFSLALGFQIAVMMIRKVSWDNFSYRLFGLSIAIGAGVFLVIIGYGAENLITPMMGLLGTAIGYLLGKDSPGTATTPASVTLASLTAPNIRIGTSNLATVTLSGSAPSGGAEIVLRSSDQNLVTIPLKVVVPAGASSATAPISVPPSAQPGEIATIQADYAGIVKETRVVLLPAP